MIINAIKKRRDFLRWLPQWDKARLQSCFFPLNLCRNIVVGTPKLIEETVNALKNPE